MSEAAETTAEKPAEKQTLGFQAEVRDLLKLMIDSLYSTGKSSYAS